MVASLGQGLTISALGPADLDGAQALVAEAGWNQVRADWEVFVELGAAFKVTAEGGEVAATAATLPFAGFGWISMVLVAKRQRRQGIATVLLANCIARLREQGLVPVLDATPAGRAVYRPLGFHDGWPITRWRRFDRSAAMPGTDGLAMTTVRALREDDWPQLLALDEKAFGSARIALLRRLESRSRGFACVAEHDGRVAGYLLGRNGRQATQVGPIVARDQNLAKALLGHALARIDGPVLLDVLDCHTAFPTALKAAGFEVERSFIRMTLDANAVFGDAHLMAAIAGPEIG